MIRVNSLHQKRSWFPKGKKWLKFYVKQNWKLLSPIHSCFSVRIVPELGLDPKEKWVGSEHKAGQGRHMLSDQALYSSCFSPRALAGLPAEDLDVWQGKVSCEHQKSALLEKQLFGVQGGQRWGQLMWPQLWQGRCWQQWLGHGVVLTGVGSADTRAAGSSLHELSQIQCSSPDELPTCMTSSSYSSKNTLRLPTTSAGNCSWLSCFATCKQPFRTQPSISSRISVLRWKSKSLQSFLLQVVIHAAATIFLQTWDNSGCVTYHFFTYTRKENCCQINDNILMIESCLLTSEMLKSEEMGILELVKYGMCRALCARHWAQGYRQETCQIWPQET